MYTACKLPFSAVVVGIEKTAYTVAEDKRSIQVCAVIRETRDADCPVDFSISVYFSTSDGSAGTTANVSPSVFVDAFIGCMVMGQLWCYVDICQVC